MNKIQNIKVLFWDIDNTLLDFDAGAEDSMKQAFADFGLEFKPEMFDVFQEENHIIWDKIEKGELSREDIPVKMLAYMQFMSQVMKTRVTTM